MIANQRVTYPLAVVERPVHLTGSRNDYSVEDIVWVVSQFNVDGPIQVSPFPGRGNINLHTYEVFANGQEYLLQKVNSDVFKLPGRVMNGMSAAIKAQVESLENSQLSQEWIPIELVNTKSGYDFLDLTDDHGWSVWRMMVRIPNAVSYKSLSEVGERSSQLEKATEVGRGLAIYTDLTSNLDPAGVDGSLPGYRDTGLYFRQFHSVLAGNRTLGDASALLPHDPIDRASTEQHFLVNLPGAEFRKRTQDPSLTDFIHLVRDQERFAMALWTALGEGRIRHTLIHGDTKIENFLFCAETGRVKALVDLDTIMAFTWLADWGDMVRSLVNVAGERERDLNKIQVDREVYAAVLKGFLEASTGVTPQEVQLMVPAVQAITLELGLRFLTDYLRGDTYFQLGENDPSDLNKVRASVQLTLFKRLVEFEPEARELIRQFGR